MTPTTTQGAANMTADDAVEVAAEQRQVDEVEGSQHEQPALGDITKCQECGSQSRSIANGCSRCGHGRPATGRPSSAAWTTAVAPTDGPVRVRLQQIKTTRTYTVTGVPTLMDSHRATFLPEKVEVSLRNGEATTVVVTGPHIRTGRTRSACFSVGRWPEPVPAWVAELVREAISPDHEGEYR